MEVDREIEVEKNDEKKERLKEENHVSYMQTDIRMTILFYRNAILLKCLRKKRQREHYRLFYEKHFGLPERAKLSYRSISMSFESSWYRQRRGADSLSITIK